jgi:hypothetical protein
MPGIERIKITEFSSYLNERSAKAESCNKVIDDIYKQCLPLQSGSQYKYACKADIGAMYDMIEGIDVILTLADGSKITLQEKVLFTTFRTATFETKKGSGSQGAWFYCTAQLYFVGYVSQDTGLVTSYVLIDLARLKIEHNRNALKWQYRKNNKDGRKEEFMYIMFDDIPNSCIISILNPKKQEPQMPVFDYYQFSNI